MPKPKIQKFPRIDLEEYKAELKDTRKLVNSSRLDLEVDELQKLKATYHKIPRISGFRKRLDALTNALIQANSHEERLVSLRVSLSRCQRIANRQYDKAYSKVVNEASLIGIAKKDQDLIFARELLFFTSVTTDVEYKIEQIDLALTYVRNTSFNLKTLLSTLKTMDKYSDEES